MWCALLLSYHTKERRESVIQAKSYSTKNIVSCGLLAGISIILTRVFSYTIPIAGFPALRIGFGDIPVIISGMLFGPVAGALTGTVSDVLGFMINPMGAFYIPGMTISAALRGFIPGLFYWAVKNNKIKLNFHFINIIFSILMVLGAIYVPLSQNEGTSTIALIFYGIIAFVFIMLPVVLGIIIKTDDGLYSFDKILFVVTFCYYMISLLLNTYWLSLAYNKGFLIFLPGRIIAGLVIIPLHAIIIFVLSRWFKYMKI